MAVAEGAQWSGLFRIAPDSGRTLQSQIREAVVGAVLNGRMSAEQPLPSCRLLAKHLGVARGTVVLAYQQLLDAGFLVSIERRGHFVNPDALPVTPDAAEGRAGGEGGSGNGPDWDAFGARSIGPLRIPKKPIDWLSHPYPFVYGQFDPNLFPVNEWRECSRMALGVREIRDWAADWADRDDPLLIEQIRTRLLPRRGIFARPDEIMVTLGAQNALYLLTSLLGSPGRAFAMEDPGYPDARAIFSLGGEVVPVGMDRDGIDPMRVPERSSVLFCTPSHQCPTGLSMPLARREALLDWADEREGLIIEDDYDSQLLDRPEGGAVPAEEALPALKSLDRSGRVVHIGSLSKTLAPGLRLGYLVADADLVRRLRQLRRLVLRHPPANNQRAVAIFLSLGHHDALVRRLVRSMRDKRDALREAMAEMMPRFDAGPGAASASIWFRGPPGVDAEVLAERARARGVIVEPGAVFYNDPETAPRDALRFGVTAIERRRIEKGVAALASAMG